MARMTIELQRHVVIPKENDRRGETFLAGRHTVSEDKGAIILTESEKRYGKKNAEVLDAPAPKTAEPDSEVTATPAPAIVTETKPKK